MTAHDPLAPRRPSPADEAFNRTFARDVRRAAFVLPLIGLLASAVAILIAWPRLPDEVAMLGARVGGSDLMPKAAWPLLAAIGALVTLLFVAVISTNPGVTSKDSAEHQAGRAVGALAGSTLFTVGLTTLNVVIALFGDQRDANGDGQLFPWALLVPVLALAAAGAVIGLLSRRIRPTRGARP